MCSGHCNHHRVYDALSRSQLRTDSVPEEWGPDELLRKLYHEFSESADPSEDETEYPVSDTESTVSSMSSSSDEDGEETEEDSELASDPIAIPPRKGSDFRPISQDVTADDMRHALRADLQDYDYPAIEDGDPIDKPFGMQTFIPPHILAARSDARILARSVPRRFK